MLPNPPRQFALLTDRLDPGDPDAPTRDEVRAWGQQFAEEAIVYEPAPPGGRYTLGVFASAESARDLYGFLEPVRVVWCEETQVTAGDVTSG